MRRKGESLGAIAKKFGISRTHVLRLARDAGCSASTPIFWHRNCVERGRYVRCDVPCAVARLVLELPPHHHDLPAVRATP